MASDTSSTNSTPIQTPRCSQNLETGSQRERIETAILFFNDVLIDEMRRLLAQLRNGHELAEILEKVKIFSLKETNNLFVSVQAKQLTRKISEVSEVIDSELRTEKIDLIELLDADRVRATRDRAENFNLNRRALLDRADFHRSNLAEAEKFRELVNQVLEDGADNDRTLLRRVATHNHTSIHEQNRLELHRKELYSINIKMNELDEIYVSESTEFIQKYNEKTKKITRDNKRSRKHFSQLCRQIVEHLNEIISLASQPFE